MAFLGKWTIGQSTDVVQIDPGTGTLKVAGKPSDGSERLNAYGTNAAFTLQASNGKYVASKGSDYTADQASDGAVHVFSIVSDGAGGDRILDLGVGGKGAKQFYWNNDGGKLQPLAKTNTPPKTTSFTRTTITPGLATILKDGFSAPQPDLTWVSLAGADFTKAVAIVDFTQAILKSADLSKAQFPDNTPFDSAQADGARFVGAALPGCSFGGQGSSRTTLRSADFSNAKMVGIDLSGADLTGATLTEADLSQAANLAHSVFDKACMAGAKLPGVLNILDTSFVGADLTGVDFTGSSVTGTMTLSGANCTDVGLSNPADSVTIFPKMLVIDAKTNFHGATIRYLDLTGYDLRSINFAHADLTGCKLDKTRLDRANLGYATLDETTVTGGVSMHGANFANASMQGADLTGAQMGAVSQLFRVGSTNDEYAAFLAALRDGDGNGVKLVFSKNKYRLDGSVSVTPSQFAPDTAWRVHESGGQENDYSVFLEGSSSAPSLNVYQAATPAVLTNAFLVNATLTGANLFNVRASGAQLYATAGNQVNLNRAKVNGLQANNANLSGIDLSQANLAGVNFDYAVLTNVNMSGATLSVDASGGQPSFNGANLQGANFNTAAIHDVVFANAAVAVENPDDTKKALGVWQFDVDRAETELVTPEFDAATQQFDVPIELLPSLSHSGPVPKGLIAAFGNAGITLSADAILVRLTNSVFWKLADDSTDYVIFQTVSSEYEPSLGVAKGSTYTVEAEFYLPLSLESALGNGPASDTILKAFQEAGYPLDTQATITTAQHPIEWQVVDGSKLFSLWMVFDSTVVGVDTKIAARRAIPTLVSLFNSVSIALSTRATISKDKSGIWQVSNDANNPFNAAQGYIEFNVIKTADGLGVYGSWIRIVRLVRPGVQQFTNIPCQTTQISEQQLSGAGNTICPNSATPAANKADKLPFDQWLRARFLPRPPFCVPDPKGKFFCPS